MTSDGDDRRLRLLVAQNCFLGSATQIAQDGRHSPLMIMEAGVARIVVGMSAATAQQTTRWIQHAAFQNLAIHGANKTHDADVIPAMLRQRGVSIALCLWKEVLQWAIANLT